MKNIILPALLLMMSVQLIAQKPVQLKKVIELKMPLTADDDMCGTRGASIVWHPVQKKYYAVFAGNKDYPLGIFDATGKRISADDAKALIDTRGLWYDADKKLITGNAYSDYGWFTYKLAANGKLTDYLSVAEGMNQPDAQSVGSYNSLAKRVMFMKGGQVIFYNNKQTPVDSVTIHFNRTKAEGIADSEDPEYAHEDFNYTSALYTGIKGSEMALLNKTDNEIGLYDMKSGFETKKFSLPVDAPTEMMFNFAYTNGTWWLFDIKNRTWIGYR